MRASVRVERLVGRQVESGSVAVRGAVAVNMNVAVLVVVSVVMIMIVPVRMVMVVSVPVPMLVPLSDVLLASRTP